MGYLFDGKYTFRLVYDDGEELISSVPEKEGYFDIAWTQTNWLTDSSISGSSLAGIPFFDGLAMSDSDNSFLDGNGNEQYWFNAAGNMCLFCAGNDYYYANHQMGHLQGRDKLLQ